MRISAAPFVLAALLGVAGSPQARGEQKTVCTITVNSADEKEAFRRSLPPDKFRFVELVERGRADWLASACRAGIRCDVLIISGHYDGGHEFFSDRTEAQEFLPVDEMERVACSDSCPGLFSRLKDVYLFGCNTLNPEARRSASAEIERSLVRSGHSRADAQRLARMLADRHAESARDRMQQIFEDVPAIYGFSSVAPVGPVAGSILNRYFQSGGASEVGSGRSSGRLLGAFTGHSLAVTRGMSETDPRAAHRRDICQFADDRLSPAQKLGFVHRLLDGEMAEVRLFLDRLETHLASLDAAARQEPSIARALEEIAQDRGARNRYLAFARDADQPAVRVRMLDLAQALGWLTADDRRAEVGRMIADDIGRNAVDAAEVGLVCSLDSEREPLALQPMELSVMQAGRLANVAMLACLGNADARARVLAGLTSSSDGDAEVAQVYLRHRPIGNVDEQRALTAEIARMTNPKAQARAIETLGRLGVSDRASLETLSRLLHTADSPAVQSAIAGVLLRADRAAIADPELRQALLERRPRTASGTDVIDALLRRIDGP
jgi:hypothetical protein